MDRNVNKKEGRKTEKCALVVFITNTGLFLLCKVRVMCKKHRSDIGMMTPAANCNLPTKHQSEDYAL